METNASMLAPTAAPFEERLERGEVVYFPVCPFPLPAGDDRAFLLQQQLGAFKHKNVSFDPASGRAAGFVRRDDAQAERLTQTLADFARGVTDWLGRALPRYRGGCLPDRVSYRPQEEATRKLRHTARNDLLHVDAFPSRPSQGNRILRVFANLNPSEPRVWATSFPFAALLARYGEAAGLPGLRPRGWLEQLGEAVLGLFRPHRRRRSPYDSFMLRFHDYLKRHDEFQERAPKRLWKFPPGCAWMAMTDTCSHAVLRGRFALEHSYFVSPTVLVLPDESPEALLTRCGDPTPPRRAA
jgi:hypothetical protein